MTHIITSLCLRDNGCSDVCPVECINPGTPVEQWSTYYIDPSTCNEVINKPGLMDHYEGTNHRQEKIILNTTRALNAGEIVDLRTSIPANYDFYK